MNKKNKCLIVVLLIVSMLAATCTQFLSVLAVSTNEVEEDGLITRTWDFDDKSQEHDFTFLKKTNSNVSGYAPEGRLLFPKDSNSDGNRRVLLNESLDVTTISVDIYPQGTNWKEGGIILGDDGNNGTNNLLSVYASNCVEFKICAGSSSDWIALKAVKYKENKELFVKWYQGFDNTKPIRLSLEINGTTVKATITALDGSGKTQEATIDITKDKNGNNTTYTKNTLVGRPGLSGGLGDGVEFNDFTISLSDSQTRIWDFNSQSQKEDFVFLKKSESNASAYITDGTMFFAADNSSDGNRRAILNESLDVTTISVDIYPQGTNWKEGGIILGDDGNNGTNNLLSIYASNCVEFKICAGSSSDWIALKAVKYKENKELFVKWYQGFDNTKPMRLSLEVDGTTVKATITALDGSGKTQEATIDITKDKNGNDTTYTKETLIGRPGLSAGLGAGVAFNNFTISLYDPTMMIWDFDTQLQEEDFIFLKKNESNVLGCVHDGTMVFPVDNSSDGNRRAILRKWLEVTNISADIYPQGTNWKESGIILGDDGNDGTNNLLSIYASNCVEFKICAGSSSDWIALKVIQYKENKELFVKWYQGFDNTKPMRLSLDVDGTTVKATITALDGSGKTQAATIDITKDKNGNDTTYTKETLIGRPGLSGGLGDGVKIDNLTIKAKEAQKPEPISVYKQQLLDEIEKVQTMKQGNITESSWSALQDVLKTSIAVANSAESTERKYVDAYCALRKAEYNLSATERPNSVTKTYNFDSVIDALDFEFYRSATSGGFNVMDGKLLHYGAKGEAKALLNGEGRTYESISVDIYPGEDETIYAGLYFGASDAGSADDDIEAATLIIESRATDPSQINLILGEFPWKSLQRTSISNANGNALFTEGKREPLNLQVDINGDELVVRLSLLNNPEKFVYVTYEYKGNYQLLSGNVGLRSLKSNNMFDNLVVTYHGGTDSDIVYIDSSKENANGDTNNNDSGNENQNYNTGDKNHLSVWMIAMLVASCGIISFVLVERKNKTKRRQDI